ncbi:ATP-binding protein [Vibrio alginolyticus]|nr:ATP-binding protein [Vibrio alginolyticus]
MKDLTIICGRNGVGKTYLSYSYYMLVNSLRSEIFKNIIIPKDLNSSVSQIASTRSPARKTLEYDFDEFNLGKTAILNALEAASDNDSIYESLDLSMSHDMCITGSMGDDFFTKIKSSEADISLKGTVDIRVAKPKDTNTIRVVLSKESEEELDFDSIVNDLNFIVGIFFLEHIAHLSQFPITSERTGISLFYEDLTLNNKHIDGEGVNKKAYSQPIETNIRNMRSMKNRKHVYNDWMYKQKPAFQKQVSDLLGGNYRIEDNSLFFQPKGKDVLVPLRSSSGASKSLMLLDYFMYVYESFGSLIIDEPELNLHLDSQKEVARILCSIANMGIRVVVTTHSDHFIREINNLIMLSSPKIPEHQKQEIRKKAGINTKSVISPEKVSTVVLSAHERQAYKMKISEYGIDLKLFNDEIMASNDISNELMMAIYEA